MAEAFRKFSSKTSEAMGSAGAFLAAAALIVAWAISGPFFHFSDTWELLINTATTIVTFLMVFLIQNTQNRDSRAIHLKLDELLHAIEGARTGLVDLENMSDKELKRLQTEFTALREEADDLVDMAVGKVAGRQERRSAKMSA